jgi:HEAT repeat protein
MRSRTRIGLVLAMASVVVSVAHGQPAKKDKKRAPAPKLDPALVAALEGADDEAAAKAADALGELADPAAHDALLDALAFGLRAQVASPAIAALAKHPAPPDVVALKRYANHRNPGVRGAAFGALALYPDPAAHVVVALGLHDPSTIVRSSAALAAAKGHVREAVDPLFELLARGEDSAGGALAAMADAELVRRIGDQLGKVPDAALAKCLGAVLKRTDFGPDAARVDVVRAIAKIQDPAATNALQDYVDATPKSPPRPSRQEAEKVVEARGGK